MQGLHQLEIVIVLLVAVLALVTIARRILIPYPIFLVLGGLGLGVVPNVPIVRLDPDLVFLIFLASAGGVVIGLIVGGVACRTLRLTDDSVAETAITLLAPYAAWVLAERSHASAVLACVAGGLYFRQGFSAAAAPTTRLQAKAVWDLLVFI